MKNKEFDRIIGERVKSARNAKKLTQEYVAGELNISGSELSRIEKGERGLDISYVPKLSEILGVDVMLLDGSFDKIEDTHITDSVRNDLLENFLEFCGFEIIVVPNEQPKGTYYPEVDRTLMSGKSFISKIAFRYTAANGQKKRCVFTPDQESAFCDMVVDTIKRNLDLLSSFIPEGMGVSDEEFNKLKEEQIAERYYYPDEED